MRTPCRKRVYIYADDLPQKTGSGAKLRLYSNVRAYLDLGFDVELVQITAREDRTVPSSDLPGLILQRVLAQPAPPSLRGKIAYRAASTGKLACGQYFKTFDAVLRIASKLAKTAPEALHQFEGDAMASVTPFLPGVRKIWSCHDIASEILTSTTRISQEIEGRPATRSEKRELRFARRLQHRIVRGNDLVLCISSHDRDVISSWGCAYAEHLPMSIPEGGDFRLPSGRLRDGRLTLLHLGALAHLPSYRSLEFLFGEVLPLLGQSLLNRLVIRIAGSFDRSHPRCQRILPLIERYPQAEMLGYVPDLTSEYSRSDLQIVTSTEASGLRTRIIESFAFGLPVLSTAMAARGIVGLEPGSNILQSGTAEGIAEHIRHLIENPGDLPRIAKEARRTYEQFHSRATTAALLREYLTRHIRVEFV